MELFEIKLLYFARKSPVMVKVSELSGIISDWLLPFTR